MSVTLALAGNPNVGKSTVFNALTGARQHTGNWAGKTVEPAWGRLRFGGEDIKIVDLPGTYSLSAQSADERAARDYICFGDSDGIIIVCDATCLERNLILTVQTLEITSRAVICLNLTDEAEKKGISVDADRLSELLGVRVIPAAARGGRGIEELKTAALEIETKAPLKIDYGTTVETAVAIVEAVLADKTLGGPTARWLALKLLENDEGLLEGAEKYLGFDASAPDVAEALRRARAFLRENGLSIEDFRERLVGGVIAEAEYIAAQTVKKSGSFDRDRHLDKIFTGKIFAVPVMLCLLMGIMWLTAVGANYPSALLSRAFSAMESALCGLLENFGCARALCDILSHGIFRVLGWVVAVMLPPMAIFFPLFTLLEDFGYLPRIAFNLDCCFRRCGACGKQALTTCMGFGCNAVGITGCRIIDSPREKLTAMLTNCFVPCNGRLPSLIAVISMFLACGGAFGGILEGLLLACTVLLGLGMTLVVCAILNKTLLRGFPSSFALELPPYRRPQIGKVIVRSVLDRTIYVLGRAAAVAAPAGGVIWLLANVSVGDASLLSHIAAFLDPLGRLMGLDGVILLGFVLGFPANEIVIPLILMGYTCNTALVDYESLSALQAVLSANGWNRVTAVCFIIFTLFHFPCSTSCITVFKETRSLKWTLLSMAIPTVTGVILCMAVNALMRII